ncbi:MAG: M28 family peptidase [Candidatus Aminicenantes bacterium]|nr:M28 family peptidase [Candidatus Aminicenantes bacterium]
MRSIRSLFLIVLSAVLFWACGGGGPGEFDVQPGEIEAHIRFLSDDLLEGRSIGSRGLALAALYQENIFRALGLEPAFGDSYRQKFELKGSLPDKEASLQVLAEDEILSFQNVSDFVITSHREDCPEGVEGEIVYGGFLIQAPERDWDDIKDADLKGKVLLVEINEPGNRISGIFEGEDMTYYGRWTYKYEKASELGATGIIIIHNTKGASYGWDVVRNSWSGEGFFLPDKETNLFFQGWVQGDVAEKISSAAGQDYEALKMKAETKEFHPVPLGLKMRVRQKPSFRSVATENVVAMIRGKHKKSRDRFVILSAHYDHLGKEEDKEGDCIYNGAVDNCSASATMLSLARYYSQRAEDLKVNLIFAAVTAEEEGLLGSDYFARHLPVPVSSVLGNLNFEMTNVWGETRDVYAIGGRHSDLEDFAREAAEKLGLAYIPERGGEFGFFFRSDQLSFARSGIPAVWLHEGIRSRGEDEDLIKRKRDMYQAEKYHKVADEIELDWDLMGAVQIARWADQIISLLAETEELPGFKPKSSFKRKQP